MNVPEIVDAMGRLDWSTPESMIASASVLSFTPLGRATVRGADDAIRFVMSEVWGAMKGNPDSRRARNTVAAVVMSSPDLREDARTPDEDWVSEWINLASKRSREEWTAALSKMLTMECNKPGSVPLRYFTRMHSLDDVVLREFSHLCGWRANVVTNEVNLIVPDSITPVHTTEVGLVEMVSGGSSWTRKLHRNPLKPGQVLPDALLDVYRVQTGEQPILLKYEEGVSLHLGPCRLTTFGELVLSLLDPPPALNPGLVKHLLDYWRKSLCPSWSQEVGKEPRYKPSGASLSDLLLGTRERA